MNSLNTYRKFLNFNKLFDMFLMLLLVVITIVFLGAIFYFTESYVLLFIICLVIYCISICLCKLFEVKIMLPSIMFVLVTAALLVFVLLSDEKKYVPNNISDFIPLVIIGVGVGGLIFALYKYETPVSIYYRIKDAFSGLSYGNKIKKIKNEEITFDTNTIYANNLLFERDKLLFKLNEDYNEEHYKLDNLYKKSIDKQKKEKEELQYLEEKMNKINTRLKCELSGAQDYELNVQKDALKEKISAQKDVLVSVNDEVTKNKNSLLELDKIYDNEKYYLKNAYAMRYGNYVERIQDKLIKTKYKLNVISFEELTIEEGE